MVNRNHRRPGEQAEGLAGMCRFAFLRDHNIGPMTMMQIHVPVDTHDLTIRNLTTSTA